MANSTIRSDSAGPSWLTVLCHAKDSLWSVDLFRCESAVLRTHWVLVVMDQCTGRIVGFGVHRGVVDGVGLCRTFNRAIGRHPAPTYLSSDHDPLYRFHQWQANLRILDVEAITTVPYAPLSHPFVERLIGTIRRECLVEHAADALATAIDAYIKDRRDIPLSSAIVTKHRVTPPALVETKVRLYETMRLAKVGKSELAKRLNWHLPQVDRLLEMTHGSKLEQLEAAFAVLGKRLVVGIEDLPSAAHRRSEVKERTRDRVRRRMARTTEAGASAKRTIKKHRRSLERLAK
jgi:hypothetical protein